MGFELFGDFFVGTQDDIINIFLVTFLIFKQKSAYQYFWIRQYIYIIQIYKIN